MCDSTYHPGWAKARIDTRTPPTLIIELYSLIFFALMIFRLSFLITSGLTFISAERLVISLRSLRYLDSRKTPLRRNMNCCKAMTASATCASACFTSNESTKEVLHHRLNPIISTASRKSCKRTDMVARRFVSGLTSKVRTKYEVYLSAKSQI